MIGFPRAPQSSRKRGEKRRGRESSRRARRSTCQRRRRETPPRTQRKGWGKRAPSGGKLPPSSPRFCALLFLGSAAAKPLLAGTPRLVCFLLLAFTCFCRTSSALQLTERGGRKKGKEKPRSRELRSQAGRGKGGERGRGLGERKRQACPRLSQGALAPPHKSTWFQFYAAKVWLA